MAKTKRKSEKPGKGNQNASKFKKEFLAQVEEMAGLGLPDKDIAVILNINPETIVDWKKLKPAFNNAILRGRANGHKSMTKALFDRGCGFEREEEIVSVNKKTGELYKETVTKFYPPDPTCIQYHLGNRHKESWSSTQKIEARIENIPGVDLVPIADFLKIKKDG